MIFKSTGVQIRLFFVALLFLPNSAPLAAERKKCRSQSSRGGSSLNILELQKSDVLSCDGKCFEVTSHAQSNNQVHLVVEREGFNGIKYPIKIKQWHRELILGASLLAGPQQIRSCYQQYRSFLASGAWRPTF